MSSCENKTRLKKFCETRWSEHGACLSSLLSKYKDIIQVLDMIQQVRDPKASSTSASVTRSLDSFGFLLCSIVCQKLLQYLTPLSTALQNHAVDLVKAAQQTRSLVELLELKRADEAHFNSLWVEATKMAEENDIEVSVPRTVNGRSTAPTHQLQVPRSRPTGGGMCMCHSLTSS